MAETTNLPQKDRAEETRTETTRGGLHFVPRVDIYETENELYLIAEAPGARPDDVDLHYENGELTLYARVQPRRREQEYLLQEYDDGDFYRAFTIGEKIDTARIEASCKLGLLTVRLPKMEAVKPRQIQVRGG